MDGSPLPLSRHLLPLSELLPLSYVDLLSFTGSQLQHHHHQHPPASVYAPNQPYGRDVEGGRITQADRPTGKKVGDSACVFLPPSLQTDVSNLP